MLFDRYSSVEFGQAGGSRKRISYSDREPVPLPGPSSLREHAIDEEIPGIIVLNIIFKLHSSYIFDHDIGKNEHMHQDLYHCKQTFI